MGLYVRRADGIEDPFDNYRGCSVCGTRSYDEPDNDGEVKCWSARCERNWRRAVWLSPAVDEDDGRLTIRAGEDTVGVYPSGGWLSWRKD